MPHDSLQDRCVRFLLKQDTAGPATAVVPLGLHQEIVFQQRSNSLGGQSPLFVIPGPKIIPAVPPFQVQLHRGAVIVGVDFRLAFHQPGQLRGQILEAGRNGLIPVLLRRLPPVLQRPAVILQQGDLPQAPILRHRLQKRIVAFPDALFHVAQHILFLLSILSKNAYIFN